MVDLVLRQLSNKVRCLKLGQDQCKLTADEASSISIAKPRGRPPSTKTSTTTSASITEKKKGRPPTITKKITTKASASKVNSTTEKSNTEKPEKETAVEDDGFVDPDIQYWLMKAEPESRIEKGYDVKFSIDDLAARTEPEGWDGKL